MIARLINREEIHLLDFSKSELIDLEISINRNEVQCILIDDFLKCIGKEDNIYNLICDLIHDFGCIVLGDAFNN